MVKIMIADKFKDEIHVYLDDVYNEFQLFQGIVREIFEEFDKLCRNNNIGYCVEFGSLLGLIRDNGFIPWDYDMDVFVSIDDRERLISVLESSLGDKFYYTYINNMKNYPLGVLRVCKKGYTYMSFHVDVFFLVGCPNTPKAQKRFVNRINNLYKIRVKKYISEHKDIREETLARKVYERIIRIPAKIIPRVVIDRLENYYYHKYPLQKSEKCLPVDKIFNIRTTEYFMEKCDLEIDGINYSVPKDFDSALKEEFGDYMTYFSIKDRFEEFYKLFYEVKENQLYFKSVLENKIKSTLYF